MNKVLNNSTKYKRQIEATRQMIQRHKRVVEVKQYRSTLKYVLLSPASLKCIWIYRIFIPKVICTSWDVPNIICLFIFSPLSLSYIALRQIHSERMIYSTSFLTVQQELSVSRLFRMCICEVKVASPPTPNIDSLSQSAMLQRLS